MRRIVEQLWTHISQSKGNQNALLTKRQLKDTQRSSEFRERRSSKYPTVKARPIREIADLMQTHECTFARNSKKWVHGITQNGLIRTSR